MTETARVVRLRQRIEVLISIRKNTKISNVDLLESHHTLRSWLKAYSLQGKIHKMSDMVFLGPFWDLLVDCSIHLNHCEKEAVLHHFLRDRHHI